MKKAHTKMLLAGAMLTCFAQAQTATPPNANPPTINFDKTKDLFLAQFDSKPDPDDIHAIAALGSMLAHPDLHNVDYYAVQGSVGKQNGKFIPAPGLMNLAFGQQNVRWTQAGVGQNNTSVGTANWNSSVDRVRNKAKTALDRGGKIYVMDAGNENFTHDWVQELVAQTSYTTNDTKSRVIVVQHSNWNEEQTTTAGVLNWVRNNTDYRRIEDGNGSNSTPDYTENASTWVNQAEASNNANSHARALWLEAESAITAVLPRTPTNQIPTYSSIRNRGVDYSDVSEAWYIFNIASKANVTNTAGFWPRYVTNSNSANGPVPGPAGGPPVGNGTPFGGTPWPIPGTLEAENFNVGGQGVAYNDTGSGNSGASTYRNGTGVDISDGNATDPARLVGWIAGGEWLEYDINMSTGDVNIIARVASASTNPGDLSISIDGNTLGTFPVGNTGGWRNFVDVPLPGGSVFFGIGGNREIRLTAVGGNFNIDQIRFERPAGGGVTPPASWTQLEFRHSGSCVDNKGGNANGVEYHQWACGGGSSAANRNFQFEDRGSGWWGIRSQASNRCLDVAGGNTTDGGKLHQWDCSNGNINQSWKIIDQGGGWFSLQSQRSNKCVEVADGATNNSAAIQQWGCSNANKQQLKFR